MSPLLKSNQIQTLVIHPDFNSLRQQVQNFFDSTPQGKKKQGQLVTRC